MIDTSIANKFFVVNYKEKMTISGGLLNLSLYFMMKRKLEHMYGYYLYIYWPVVISSAEFDMQVLILYTIYIIPAGMYQQVYTNSHDSTIVYMLFKL